MRHLHLLSIFIFVTICGFSQDLDHTTFFLKEQQLSGPVKSVTHRSFSGRPDGKGGYIKGTPAYQYSWQQDMKIAYNAAGEPVSAAELNPDGSVLAETVFTYTDGKLTEVRTSETVQVFEYDDNGRMAIMGEREAVPEDAGFYAFTKYEYDAAGHLVAETDMDGEASWDGAFLYTYDAKGNLISMQYDYEDGFTETYAYDEKNRPARTVVTDEDGISEKTTFTYDGKKMTETWELYEEGVSIGKIIYTYEKGLEVKSVEYDGQTITETQVTTYEFDAKDNWIRKVVAINGKTFFIEERTIVYY